MSALPLQDTDSVIAELPKPKGPGARLKAARQAKQLDLDLVAAQLHLSHEMIVALEADDYEQLPARVFVVGYLRNYARHVGLPPEAIIQALNNYLPAEETRTELPKVGGGAGEIFKPSTHARHSSFSFFTLFMLVAAVALFFAWQKGLVSLPAALISGDFQQTDPVADNSLTASALIPVQNSAKNIKLPMKPSVEVSREVTKVLPVQAEPVPGSRPETPAVETGAEVGEPLEVAMVEENTVATVEAPSQVIASEQDIVLTFSEACWVDIRDASGTFKYIAEAKPGMVKKLAGKAPYKMLLGNVSGVTLTINGEPFDLQRYNKANVARFSLDPSSL